MLTFAGGVHTSSSSEKTSSGPEFFSTSAAQTEGILSSFKATSAGAAMTTSTSEHLDRLLEAKKYAELYFLVSALYTPSTAASVEDITVIRLLCYRARCSYCLMNYSECIEDGMTVLQQWRSWAVASGSAEKDDGVAAVVRCVLVSYVMREMYTEALEFILEVTEMEWGVFHACLGDPHRLVLKEWLAALPIVEEFRSCITQQKWADAEKLFGDVAPCVSASPLSVLRGFVQVQQGKTCQARLDLIAYLTLLVEPPARGAAALPPEHHQVWENYRFHYVSTTTLLSKASIYCGTAFLNLAAVLIQRSLSLLPAHLPSRQLGAYLVSLEEQLQKMEAALQKNDYAMALSAINTAAQLDATRCKLRSELYLHKAEVHWRCDRPLHVIEDCTQALAMDEESALALRFRAEAYAMVGEAVASTADAAAATALNSQIEDIFSAFRKQRSILLFTPADRKASRQQHSPSSRTPPNLSFSTASTSSVRHSPPHTVPLPTQRPRQSIGSSTAHGKAARSLPPLRRASTRTLYDILGVTSRASDKEIRHRYRQLTLLYHPDRLVGTSSASQSSALEAFKELSNAYSILSDPQQRIIYDNKFP